MKTSSVVKRILLSIALVASSTLAFAATGDYLLGAKVDSTGGGTETYAMLLAGLGLMGTIARRRSKQV
jgi:hypothetical protein